MEAKKTPKADLENKKRIFMQIGLAFALLGVLVAFEWKQYERPEYDLGTLDMDYFEEEDIPITRQEQPPPPPPPEPSQELVIVDDDVEIEEEFTIDVEATVFTEVQEFAPITMAAEEEEVEEDVIFTVVEDQPQFPGGETARVKFLSDNLRYPTMAREAGIQGTVFVTFVVERDGSVTDVRVLRGIGGGCDEEAIRVVQNMPRWEPGRQRGQPVRVQFNMPIRFMLN